MLGSKRFLLRLAPLTMAGAFLLAPLSPASDVDRLLDLLVRKHLVTEEEAASLRAEMAKEKEQGPRPEAVRQETPAPPQGGESLAPVESRSAQKESPVLTSLPFKLSGFVQTRWSEGPGRPHSFEIWRARLQIAGELSDNISYFVQTDAARSLLLLDANVDLKLVPFATLTIGQFKIPFSQENLVPDSKWIPVERSMIGNNLVPNRDTGFQGRDIGVQLSGSLPRGTKKALMDYAVGVFDGAGINKIDDNNRKDVATRIAVHPFSGLTFAGDYYLGAIGAKKLPKERAGLEFAYLRKPFSAYGEYIWGHDDAIRKNGWYTLFAYRFTSKWEGLVRFDNFDSDLHGHNTQSTTYLLGLNWNLNRWLKWQTNYGVEDQQARARLAQVFLTQVQFTFQLSGREEDAGE